MTMDLAVIQSVTNKRLPFERHTLVESRECPRCKGLGNYASHRTFGDRCMTCHGWGRLPTFKGRELLDKVALLIGGFAAYDEKGRFEGGKLRQIFARGLRAGMRIREYAAAVNAYRMVTEVEFRGDQGVIVRFNRGYPLSTTDLGTFSRELTDDEIDRADVFMAQFVGNGAVRVTE